jgi:hypothetical protein
MVSFKLWPLYLLGKKLLYLLSRRLSGAQSHYGLFGKRILS